MATTLNKNMLMNIRVTGKGLQADLVDSCTKATFSTACDAVTEMSLTFQDSMDLAIFRSGVLASGATVSYGGWSMVARTQDLASGNAGPQLTIKAPSLFVERLRGQVGEKAWGRVDVSAWVAGVAAGVGMKTLVQPGLGQQTLVRAKPEGDNRESTWDVLTSAATQAGVWLFEYGNILVFAKPSWLIKTTWARRSWDLWWDNWSSYSDGMGGMPKYSKDPNSNPGETLTVRLVSPDADQARPGDAVVLTGKAVGAMKGTWIVKSVDYPMTVAGAVTLACVRPVDPTIPPEGTAEKSTATGGTKTAQAATAGSAAVDRYVTSVNGKSIDVDGAYGAQCVDLVQHYFTNVVGGGNVFGNGKDWYNNSTALAACTQVAAGAAARKGDIACYGPSHGGGYGHVAIVLDDLGGSLKTLTQNPGPAHIENLGKAGLMGYLRPKKALT